MADTRDSVTKQILAGTFDRNRDIKKLRADGMTYKAIGSFYGLTKQRVHRIITNPFDNHPPEADEVHQDGKLRRLRGWLRAMLKKVLYTDISIGG